MFDLTLSQASTAFDYTYNLILPTPVNFLFVCLGVYFLAEAFIRIMKFLLSFDRLHH